MFTNSDAGPAQEIAWLSLLLFPWLVSLALVFPALFSAGRKERLAVIAGLYVALNVVLPAYLALRFLDMTPLGVAGVILVYRVLDLEGAGGRKVFVGLWTMQSQGRKTVTQEFCDELDQHVQAVERKGCV
jgi:hypothetical protein